MFGWVIVNYLLEKFIKVGLVVGSMNWGLRVFIYWFILIFFVYSMVGWVSGFS